MDLHRLTGFVPFSARNLDEIIELNKNGQLEFPTELWKNISAEAQDLVKAMTQKDPLQRIKANDCINHKWFSCKKSDDNSLEIVVENLKKHFVE